MINEMGKLISRHNQINSLLSQVVEILKNRLEYDRGIILLASEDKKNLEYKAGYGYSPDSVRTIESTRFRLDNAESKGAFVLCYREKRPFLVNDVEGIKDSLSEHSLEFLKAIKSKAFICCPILHEDECLGVLAVDNFKSTRPLLERDMNLIMGIAPEIGMSVHNALMIEEREAQFRSILRVLAASIDARDSLTAGHSERVTEYSMAICERMRLPVDFIEVVRVASQLHDYGKIGIKDSILKKSGPLSLDEREEIKTHAEKTKRILDQINFSGIYQSVPAIAGAHHERMDGNGYPDGLSGEGIPLGSRIIAVADFYEAITAKRHYREPMAYADAVQTLRDAGGSHLDAAVVDVFIEILEEWQVEDLGVELVLSTRTEAS
jgi:HD-GYP domain-containing protein (c-di-GMP phosphodiesterase class II)